MNKVYFSLIILIFLNVISFPSFNDSTPDSEGGLASFLPQSGEAESWSRNENFEEYKGEDLFFYINGGAEIYHEYGFERVIVQDYTNKNGKSVSLEIFEMTDPSSAYGMYSFKSEGEGKTLDLGNEAKLQDYYMNFWKSRYLITLTGFDEEDETIEGLHSLATATDLRITENKPSERPAVARLLPEDDLKPHDVKYFKGNLGLFNSYPFTTKSVFQVKEAVKGTYSSGYDIYVIKYSNEDESHRIFRAAIEGLGNESRYKSRQSKEGFLELIDEKDTLILIKPYKNFISIILGEAGFDQAAKTFDRLRIHINSR